MCLLSGAFVPFINVFLTSIGLSVSEAGFIGGMRLVSSSVAGPLWGFLADHTGYRKLIFTVLCLCTAFTISSLPWTAKGGCCWIAWTIERFRMFKRKQKGIFYSSVGRMFSTNFHFWSILTIFPGHQGPLGNRVNDIPDSKYVVLRSTIFIFVMDNRYFKLPTNSSEK